MRLARFGFLGLAVALAACSAAEPEEGAARVLPVHGYAELGGGRSNGCGDQPEQLRLIRDTAAWEAFWAQMHGETEPAPAVDFETASVLAVCSWLSDPGVSLEITTFEAAATHLTAYVTKVSQCGAHPQVIVFGYHALRIDGVFESADFQQAYASGPSCGPLGEPFGWETITYGQASGCREALDTVIRNDEDWAAFWTLLHSTVQSEPERPVVDFDTESVLASCSGERPDGGYYTYIAHLTRPDDAGHVALGVREYEAGPDCAVTLAVTQPYHVIRVNRVVESAAFHHLARTFSCD